MHIPKVLGICFLCFSNKLSKINLESIPQTNVSLKALLTPRNIQLSTSFIRNNGKVISSNALAVHI